MPTEVQRLVKNLSDAELEAKYKDVVANRRAFEIELGRQKAFDIKLELGAERTRRQQAAKLAAKEAEREVAETGRAIAAAIGAATEAPAGARRRLPVVGILAAAGGVVVVVVLGVVVGRRRRGR